MQQTDSTLTRRDVVLGATGGQPDWKYQRLVDGLGLEIEGGRANGPLERLRLQNGHLAVLRQIAHEIYSSPSIRSLIGGEQCLSPAAAALPPRIDVENEMGKFVRAFGGRVVTDIIGHSPPFANADYVFPDANIVAELKCLTEDKSEDDRLKRHIQRFIEQCIAEGSIRDPGPGRHLFQSKDLPARKQRELYQILGKPLKRRLSKANTQIKETKIKLNMPSAHGLVLMVNDGNYQLEPAQWAHAVDVALGRELSGIDSVLMFTVNLLATTPEAARHAFVWMPASRAGHPILDEDFLRRFREGWLKHIARLNGEDFDQIRYLDAGNLETVKFDKRTSSARQQE